MITYKCMDCGLVQPHTCTCESKHLKVLGDMHLISMGVDAYLKIHTVNSKAYLIIKKPSGQVTITLQDQDLITSFTA